ncbi:MAG: response regulator, partial [Rickettsiales bacterium]|nr:response regulator [Rickettsiales bacterium]
MTQKKTTVLVIEDEKPIRKVLTVALENADYKVVECDNGKEGIRLATSTRPELMVLDLGLPDIDGKDVITSVRAWSALPIIVCSVRAHDNDMIQALNLGADDYVTKPFNPE